LEGDLRDFYCFPKIQRLCFWGLVVCQRPWGGGGDGTAFRLLGAAGAVMAMGVATGVRRLRAAGALRSVMRFIVPIVIA